MLKFENPPLYYFDTALHVELAQQRFKRTPTAVRRRERLWSTLAPVRRLWSAAGGRKMERCYEGCQIDADYSAYCGLSVCRVSPAAREVRSTSTSRCSISQQTRLMFEDKHQSNGAGTKLTLDGLRTATSASLPFSCLADQDTERPRGFEVVSPPRRHKYSSSTILSWWLL